MSVATRVSVLAVVSVALAAALACGGGKPAEEASSANQPVQFPTQAVGPFMHDHFSRVAVIRDAVIRADLEDVVDPATWISDHEAAPGLPESAAPRVTEMKAVAKRIAEAPDLGAAAQAMGSLAVSCGACHAAMATKIPLPPAPAATSGKETKGQMLNHRRAMELLYDGLVAPSSDAWARGSEELKGAPLSSPVKDAKLKAEVDKMVAQARSLATDAAKAADATGRAKVYGELLATCAACHRLQGIVIGAGLPTGTAAQP